MLQHYGLLASISLLMSYIFYIHFFFKKSSSQVLCNAHIQYVCSANTAYLQWLICKLQNFQIKCKCLLRVQLTSLSFLEAALHMNVFMKKKSKKWQYSEVATLWFTAVATLTFNIICPTTVYPTVGLYELSTQRCVKMCKNNLKCYTCGEETQKNNLWTHTCYRQFAQFKLVLCRVFSKTMRKWWFRKLWIEEK